MSRGHLLNDRDLVARLVPRLACFCEDHAGAAPLGRVVAPWEQGLSRLGGEDF